LHNEQRRQLISLLKDKESYQSATAGKRPNYSTITAGRTEASLVWRPASTRTDYCKAKWCLLSIMLKEDNGFGTVVALTERKPAKHVQKAHTYSKRA